MVFSNKNGAWRKRNLAHNRTHHAAYKRDFLHFVQTEKVAEDKDLKEKPGLIETFFQKFQEKLLIIYFNVCYLSLLEKNMWG